MMKSSALFLASALALSATGALAADDGAKWGYEGDGSPEKWGDLAADYAACNTGAEQSPINIEADGTVPADFATVEISWSEFPAEVLNNGHTIQVNSGDAGGFLTLGDVRYNLLQYHFHAKSEHTIGGSYAPMEVHFVHASEAGDLLVVGVMIEEGEANPAIDAAWAAIPAEAGASNSGPVIDPAAMLPDDLSAYRYQGSLTTPPCTEIVTWNLLKTPITASAEQIAAFTAMYPNNYRPVQPQNRRYVLDN